MSWKNGARRASTAVALFIALTACQPKPIEGGSIGPLPGTVRQSVSQGGPNPPTTPITLSSSGTCDLDYSATSVTTDGRPWLSVTPRIGVVPAGATQPLDVSFDVVTPQLYPGTYTGTIIIAGTCADTGSPAAGSPAQIAVNLTVTPMAAVLTVDTTEITQDVAPLADLWSQMAESHLIARSGHSAVWTGREMIVWGGTDGSFSRGDGAAYDPLLADWRPLPMAGAPAPRTAFTTVWTGSSMIVWGGYDNTLSLGDGAAYEPMGDGWTALPTLGAPSNRRGHSAVWTGTEMIVWGGITSVGADNTGARFDPSNGTWTAMSSVGAPSARSFHAALWTGTEMIIWGGIGAGTTGGRYDPATDTWRGLSVPEMPPGQTLGVSGNRAVWTGKRMLVWGGEDASSIKVNTGAIYDPVRDRWRPMATAGAPAAVRGNSAVWTGERMLVFGGVDAAFNSLAQGAVYDPSADEAGLVAWTPMTATDMPVGRSFHSAVWTGTQMFVWGGQATSPRLSDGASYE